MLVAMSSCAAHQRIFSAASLLWNGPWSVYSDFSASFTPFFVSSLRCLYEATYRPWSVRLRYSLINYICKNNYVCFESVFYVSVFVRFNVIIVDNGSSFCARKVFINRIVFINIYLNSFIQSLTSLCKQFIDIKLNVGIAIVQRLELRIWLFFILELMILRIKKNNPYGNKGFYWLLESKYWVSF